MCVCGRFYLADRNDKYLVIGLVGGLNTDNITNANIKYICSFYNSSNKNAFLKNGFLYIERWVGKPTLFLCYISGIIYQLINKISCWYIIPILLKLKSSWYNIPFFSCFIIGILYQTHKW